jgi:hypothetical protein
MSTCSEASKKALDDTINYLNKLLAPKSCPNYIDVPWPINRTPEFDQEVCFGKTIKTAQTFSKHRHYFGNKPAAHEATVLAHCKQP